MLFVANLIAVIWLSFLSFKIFSFIVTGVASATPAMKADTSGVRMALVVGLALNMFSFLTILYNMF